MADVVQQQLEIAIALRHHVIEMIQTGEQPLENVTADASLERNEYQKLELRHLARLDDAEALYQIADRLVNGVGTLVDIRLGRYLMIEAARRGHPVALGVCFLHRFGVVKNKPRAVELFRASADRGHASGTHTNSHFDFQFSRLFFRAAQYCLARDVVANEDEEAEDGELKSFRLIRAAALQGNAHGQYLLGVAYLQSERTRQEGIRLLRVLASKKFGHGLFHLAKCYRKGRGVERNRLMAACLFKFAADIGNRVSARRLKSLDLNEVMLDDVLCVMCD